jgi:hypothetical protein
VKKLDTKMPDVSLQSPMEDFMNDTGQQETKKPAKYTPELHMNAVHPKIPQAGTPCTTLLWEEKSWGCHPSPSLERDPQAEALHQQDVSPSQRGGGDNPPTASPGAGYHPGRQKEDHPQAEYVKVEEKIQRAAGTSSPASSFSHS